MLSEQRLLIACRKDFVHRASLEGTYNVSVAGISIAQCEFGDALNLALYYLHAIHRFDDFQLD